MLPTVCGIVHASNLSPVGAARQMRAAMLSTQYSKPDSASQSGLSPSRLRHAPKKSIRTAKPDPRLARRRLNDQGYAYHAGVNAEMGDELHDFQELRRSRALTKRATDMQAHGIAVEMSRCGRK
jgi:hypothetical protein